MNNLLRIFAISIFYILSISCTVIFSQNEPEVSDKFNDKSIRVEKAIDTLIKKTYEELETAYNSSKTDSIATQLYATAYLTKAKKEGNVLEIANGYHMFCWITINQPSKLRRYADSIITLTKYKKYKKYPTRGYLLKGYMLFVQNNYSPALKAYLEGLKYAELKNDPENIIALKHNIALLRSILGEDQEALKTYYNNLKFIIKQDTAVKFRPHYVTTLFKISETYNQLKILDSGYFYIRKTIHATLKGERQFYYPEALITSGINSYLREDFQNAIDSLLKADELLIDYRSFEGKVNAYLWLGKSLLKQDKENEGFKYLEKVDSMTQISNYSPKIRDAYTLLIEHYKTINNKDKQLSLMQKLIQFDSITNKKHKKLNVDLVKNYDTAQLIKEKDRLIQRIQNKNKKTRYRFILTSLGIIILLTFLYYYFYKNKKIKYQKDFDKKLHNLESKNLKKTKELEISLEITDDIIKKLENFERNQGFLNSDLTMAKVAKSFKTNSTYLSKIINTHKQKNFANYLNDLRIEYCIEQMRTNRKFRLYAIKSIAKEVGFNSVQSFSSAFHKKTQKYPSEFIREIDSH